MNSQRGIWIVILESRLCASKYAEAEIRKTQSFPSLESEITYSESVTVIIYGVNKTWSRVSFSF